MRTFTPEEIEGLAATLPPQELLAYLSNTEALSEPKTWEELDALLSFEVSFLGKLVSCRCTDSLRETLDVTIEETQEGLLQQDAFTLEDDSDPTGMIAILNDNAVAVSMRKLRNRECTIDPATETILCFCDEHRHFEVP